MERIRDIPDYALYKFKFTFTFTFGHRQELRRYGCHAIGYGSPCG